MSITINRERFFAEYRERFGRLSQAQVDGLSDLLDAIERDPFMTDARWIAYALATCKWECADKWLPIDEYGTESYFNRRYGPQTAVGKRLGNTQPGDGARFHGVGFVQLTGRANHARMERKLAEVYGIHVDLTEQPHLAKRPDVAYAILSLGMREGLFTGKRLSTYISGSKRDYVGARRIINGKDRAREIAAIAEGFEEILREAAKPARPASTATTLNLVAASGAPLDTPALSSVAPGAPASVPVLAQSEILAEVISPAPVVAVEGGGPSDPAVQANKSSLVSKIMGWATGSGVMTGVAEWVGRVTGLSAEAQVLVVKGVLAVGAIGIVVAVADHFHTKWTRAQPNLINTR